MNEKSEYPARLGAALRRDRLAAGLSTRQIPRPDMPATCFTSAHISLVERGKATPSPELVESYEVFAANPGELRVLYELMFSATQRKNRERRHGSAAASPLPPVQLTDLISREDIQQHYLVQASSTVYEFSEYGSISELRTEVKLRAKVPGVRYCAAGHHYPADQRRGVLHVEALAGATIADTRESNHGALRSFFELDAEISPTDLEPYQMAFRVIVDSTALALPRLRFFAEEGSQQLRLQANFHPLALPKQIWWFSDCKPVDIEHAAGTEFPPSSTGSYGREFGRLVPNRCYGFGWRWQ
jgi:hypothetical protein